ncbi:Ig-like domain repeat protein [Micromonospora sp. PLK6-60]|uniref:immunoglobulin-like domain-containing protein n=1 Tax=Micromonospora sp. PLK6-60 TaxID=2873383 RepID=UPI001CA5FB68|nr:immunoglobulin-like domain-containing protein [Micromonospora sp. PLK6-60]MBY8875079.1 Ig-like domain repeat protein [Micromonospora sp. PLK6-60]
MAGLALGALLSVSFVATPSYAADERLNEGLVHHFALDETSGTTLVNSGSAGSAANATLVHPEKATLTGDGVRFNPDSYESALDGAYVALPNDLTAGMSNLTVDYDVWIDPANVGEHQMWSLGRKSGSCDADTGAQGAIFASNTQRFRVAVGSANLQQNRVRMLEGAWTHVTYTQALNENGTSWTGRLYLDGVLHATSTNLTTPPSVNAAGTNCNFLARSQTSGHYSFRGTLRDFRVYDRAVSLDETLALAERTVSTGVRADAAAIDLGLTSAVVRDIGLPKVGSVAGSAITWTSSDPSVVEVYTPPALNSARKVPVTGRITRPAQGQPDATATLTATVRKGAQEVTTREIPVVVKAEFDDAQAVDRDTFDLTLYATDDVRGNLDLAADGEFGSTITWKSTTDLVTPTGVVTRPAFGHADVAATLTATITKGSASKTKSFPVTITAMPRSEEHERYFMGYFKGEGIADGEQIMFATSNGNTALDWTGLTGGRPSLISQLGDQGLRDPHIVRSPDGDTFYMIATDLNWYDQGGYAINDTQYIEVFESHDLVNWTPQRHVKVAPDDAGNAFAPESLWVEEIGAYAVFWAQSLWNNPVNRTGQGNAQMWYATTRDFQTFSAPQVWQNPAPLSRIDTTAIRVGDNYYRVTKNEAGNQGSDIFSEKHTDFLDSNINNWTLVAPALGRTTWVANQGYEGPVIFKANPGDTSCPGQFYLWGDRYTNGGGYQAACHENIEAPTWNAKAITMTNAGVVRPRHGTVIPLTLREWNDIRGIPNSDVTTTTEVAVEPYASGAQSTTATATVTAADGFETGGQVRFSIGSWSQLAQLKDGAATVALPTGLPAGARTVKVEYLGFDYLKASEGTASFEVPAGSAAVKVQANAAPASVVRGDTFSLHVTVGPGGGLKQHAPIPTGEVTVTFGGTAQVVPLADGRAVVTLPTADLEPGNYRVRVAYSGNPTYQPYAADYQNLTVR